FSWIFFLFLFSQVMGSTERSSRKKVQIWKKAVFHFLLCFVMGFFTGFAPISKTSVFSSHVTMSLSSSYSPEPVELLLHQPEITQQNANRSLMDEPESEKDKDKKAPEEKIEIEEFKDSKRLLIVVTPTSSKNKLRVLLLSRLANTLRLVTQPLLWIVVEKQSDDSKVSEMLRKTGIMYRHVVFKENFTDLSSEMDHQRNIALNHIEHHRLSGIVHFAGLSNIYDLGFFEEIRAIEKLKGIFFRAFGAWPIARLSANRKRVIIEGPVCDSSEVIGWHLRKMNNSTDASITTTTMPLHISSFAFNSSILWDPERWGRTSSVQDTSQDSLRFVRKEVLEEETNLKGVPAVDCSKILIFKIPVVSAAEPPWFQVFTRGKSAMEEQKRRTLEAIERRFAQAKAEVQTQQQRSKKRPIKEMERVASNTDSPSADSRLKKPVSDKLKKTDSDTPSRKGQISFLGHTTKKDVDVNEPAYSKISHPVHENLLPNGIEVSDGKAIVNRVLHELLQHGDAAQKYMQGSKTLKIENTILLDNFIQKSGMSSGRSLQNGSKRSKKHMSLKQHKKCGSFDLPKEFHNFEIFKPMHEKWKAYITQLLKLVGKDQLAQFVQCKIAAYFGIHGIMIRETKETLGIITQDNKFRVVPKKGSVFVLQADCWKITLQGDKIASRNLVP
ncbi:galactosylgalactosylxylosylprotein 3-beta-glucuronosyltransferase, partial [Striga asiatica]